MVAAAVAPETSSSPRVNVTSSLFIPRSSNAPMPGVHSFVGGRDDGPRQRRPMLTPETATTMAY